MYIQHALESWKKKCGTIGVEIQNGKLTYSMILAGYQFFIADDYEGMGYMTSKLTEYNAI